MAGDENWVDIGSTEELSGLPLRRIKVVNHAIRRGFEYVQPRRRATWRRLDGEYIVCPWHNWKFHRCSGVGEPGFEQDRVPAYPVKVQNGRVLGSGPINFLASKANS
jgi:hypothetical protein